MKILAIDTSNSTMGVALIDGQRVLGEYISNVKKNHSIRLMPAVEQLCKHCDIKPNEIEKVVVAKGPGSYTGIRIGVTVAKTLAWTLQIPLVGISSLEALAANVKNEDKYIVPIFDARRGQVYTGLYEVNNGTLQNVKEDRIIMLEDWLVALQSLQKKVIFIGNDVALHMEKIKDILEEKVLVAFPTLHNPRPSELAFLGADKESEDVHAFVPNYIRLAEAEANWLAQQRKQEE